MSSHGKFALLAFGPLTLLSACGGGGGDVASAQPPPPAEVPVVIFANPTVQEYASVGVSVEGGFIAPSADARFTGISLDPALKPKIRYTEEGYYEVQMPGALYDRLIHSRGLQDPTSANVVFDLASSPSSSLGLGIGRSSDRGFSYSELAWYIDGSGGRTGYVAFGTPTPVSAIPVTGTATYRGPVTGMVDQTYHDGLGGGYYFEGIKGEVTLNVDFAHSSLTGSLDLAMDTWPDPRALGTFSTRPIALASDSNGFSGQFDTSQSGFNQFDGMFTGPAAEEAMGAWALPLTIDGQAHQAIGAWIARQGN